MIGTKNIEEVVGLPASLLQAGVAGVVASLWSVPENATAYLMVKFYENFLQDPSNVAVALNKAQLWLRDVSEEDFRVWMQNSSLPLPQNDHEELLLEAFLFNKQRPYHWAAFYATGQ
jgi:CHAT domain-containing protein